MAQSKATDVDGYLAGAGEDRREALTALRRLCRAVLKGFDEVMAYGMPADFDLVRDLLRATAARPGELC
ncbi:hypothetical protein QQY66_14080 [Streptomyces sp. DG2A-72]|uniref:hypothetical protein n=1 Tax=Streptomyces sp. DG2A-72 TaxID=3051386 RepID=UPI00265BC0D9|nr:hypothetical protein [Streptomyces sp. DG2A-72]MDO0932768.1 hypothetical protein [Streptomyces sp. DG2A-72]